MFKNNFINNGLFITFEGPDGCGKTTIISLVYEALKKMPYLSHEVVLTREPGGKNNSIAEDIRNILLNKLDYQISDITEVLLFAASRAQHVHDFVKPNLVKGNIVLCDRYVHSSYVYQGYARGIGIDKVAAINQFAIEGIMPQLTILLMIEPKQAIERIKNNSARDFNRLDRETIALHQKVYEGYTKLAASNSKQFKIIDATQPIEIVFKQVLDIVKQAIIDHYGKI